MRTLCAFLCLAALPALADAPSLADASKKEEARRAKLHQTQAPVRTVTEGELAANKGTLANDPNVPTPAAKTGAPAKGAPAAATSRFRIVPDEEVATDRGESYWRGRAASARSRLAAAQARYALIDRAIRLGAGTDTDGNGGATMRSIYELKEMADEAQAEVKAAQDALDALLDEGRRAGALPGWLR